jgi:hypothetical protein
MRVRIADGPPQRIIDKAQQYLLGTRLGLSANTGCRWSLPAKTDLRTLAAHRGAMDL